VRLGGGGERGEQTRERDRASGTHCQPAIGIYHAPNIACRLARLVKEM